MELTEEEQMMQAIALSLNDVSVARPGTGTLQSVAPPDTPTPQVSS